jgi:hypothetical protein
MALVFPLALADFFNLLKVRSAPFALATNQEFSGLGTGEGLAHDLGPPLWQAEVVSAEMSLSEAMRLWAIADALDGSVNSFLAFDPAARFPQADPAGAILGASAPTVHTIAGNRKELRLTGLPNGYRLSPGDMVGFAYGSGRRALHRVVTGTVSSAGTTPLFEVRPHLRPAITVGVAAELRQPAMKAKIVPGSLTPQHQLRISGTISFAMRQTLAAN